MKFFCASRFIISCMYSPETGILTVNFISKKRFPSLIVTSSLFSRAIMGVSASTGTSPISGVPIQEIISSAVQFSSSYTTAARIRAAISFSARTFLHTSSYAFFCSAAAKTSPAGLSFSGTQFTSCPFVF